VASRARVLRLHFNTECERLGRPARASDRRILCSSRYEGYAGDLCAGCRAREPPRTIARTPGVFESSLHKRVSSCSSRAWLDTGPNTKAARGSGLAHHSLRGHGVSGRNRKTDGHLSSPEHYGGGRYRLTGCPICSRHRLNARLRVSLGALENPAIRAVPRARNVPRLVRTSPS
jgi:hypothetical protein